MTLKPLRSAFGWLAGIGVVLLLIALVLGFYPYIFVAFLLWGLFGGLWLKLNSRDSSS